MPIKNPKELLVDSKVREYIDLIAAAATKGDRAVGVLLESGVAEKLAFSERTKRLIAHVIESRAAKKLAA
jgi:hypothetical protein